MIVAFMLLSACTSTDITEAEGGVAEFHRHLNNTEYDAILAMGTNELVGSRSPESVVELLADVHRQLGAVVQTQRAEALLRTSVGDETGRSVQLVYLTVFERGTATETFHWRTWPHPIRLVGYDVKRPASQRDTGSL